VVTKNRGTMDDISRIHRPKLGGTVQAKRIVSRTAVGAVLVNTVTVLLLAINQQCLAEAPLSPEALFSVKEFVSAESVAISQDGRYAAYVWFEPKLTISERDQVHIPAFANWPYLKTGVPGHPGSAITIRDLETGEEVILRGLNAAWSPAWAPRDDRLAFMCDRGGRSALWIWNPARPGGARRITSTPITTLYYSRISWTSNARSIVLSSPARGLLETLYHSTPVPSSPLSVNAEVRRSGLSEYIKGTEPLREMSLPVSAFECDVIRVDLSDGRVHILSRGLGINWVDASPDGQWLAYASMSDSAAPRTQRYKTYYDLWIVPMEGGVPKRLAEYVPLHFGFSGICWSPDSQYLAYRREGLPTEEAVVVVGINGMTPRRITDLAGAMFYDTPIWDADSRHVFVWKRSELRRFDIMTGEGELVGQLNGKTIRLLLSRGKTSVAYAPSDIDLIVLAVDDTTQESGFYRISEPSGHLTVLKEGDNNFGGTNRQWLGVAVAERSDKVIFTAESSSEPMELWYTDVSFMHLSRVSNLGSSVRKEPLGSRRIVEWEKRDGIVTRGLLLLPPNYDVHRRYPLVIWMYESSLPYANTFGLTGQAVFNCQLLATRGIACLYPDLRWESEHVMQGLHEQIVAAIRAMVDQGIADPDRIGVEGQSSGGYDVLAVIATTPMIKAAVVCSGFADMMMQYGNSYGSHWVEEQMGLGAPPWVHPELYVANSPSFHMDQVRTPVLILQGTGDTDSTIQMDLTYNLLQHLGKAVEYRRYAGEGHAPDGWSPGNRLDATKQLLGWFEKYLKSPLSFDGAEDPPARAN
jgi:dipeptidyl aminopeptidase/acylaminoacyl peptidase